MHLETTPAYRETYIAGREMLSVSFLKTFSENEVAKGVYILHILFYNGAKLLLTLIGLHHL